MGEEFKTIAAPTIDVHLVGAKKIAKVTIIKDDEEVHVTEPNEREVRFQWSDPNPTIGKTSYYYVRGEQVPDLDGATAGELAWASPMWILVKPNWKWTFLTISHRVATATSRIESTQKSIPSSSQAQVSANLAAPVALDRRVQ